MCLLGSTLSRPHIGKSLRKIVKKINHDHHIYLPLRSSGQQVYLVGIFPLSFVSFCFNYVSVSSLVHYKLQLAAGLKSPRLRHSLRL